MLASKDPLQEALNSKRSHSFYSISSNHSNFFKTSKYDLEHFGLSFTQRVTAFVICLFIGSLLLFYSFTNLLTSLFKPTSFTLSYALSNFIFFFMFGFLSGFRSYILNLFSKDKRMYTSLFIFTTLVTLYSALFLKSYVLNLVLMVLQIISFLCFSLTFIPGGAKGITSLVGLFVKK